MGKKIWTREEVEEKVRRITAEQLGIKEPADINLTDEFEQTLGADSLDSAELVMEFEDAFDLTIPNAKDSELKTVGDAVNYVFSKVGEKPS